MYHTYQLNNTRYAHYADNEYFSHGRYKNNALVLCLFMMMAGMCLASVKGIDFNKKLSKNIFQMTLQEAENEIGQKTPEIPQAAPEGISEDESRFLKIWKRISSPQRTVNYDVLVNEDAIYLEEDEYSILCRIVEAEAGNEDEMGRMMVARVVLNRVESSRFPDTVKEVVFQKCKGVYQFSPVANGSYYHVSISDTTKKAVSKVLQGEDYSQGALFFANRYAAKEEYMYWFDTNCTLLFSHGRHEFFA